MWVRGGRILGGVGGFLGDVCVSYFLMEWDSGEFFVLTGYRERVA